MIYLPVLKISSQYNMCVSSLYHYLYIYYCIKMQKFHNFTLNSGLCPQCGVIVDSSVRYSESQHQSLCNGLQQANKPELSSVASFFFTHLGYTRYSDAGLHTTLNCTGSREGQGEVSLFPGLATGLHTRWGQMAIFRLICSGHELCMAWHPQKTIFIIPSLQNPAIPRRWPP